MKSSGEPIGSDVEIEDACEVEVVHAAEVTAARARLPGAAAVDRAVELAGLLANPTRLKILAALAPLEGEVAPRLCVCDLAVVVGASETQTSHQLRALRLAGLVRQRREHRLVFYTIAEDPAVRGWVAGMARDAQAHVVASANGWTRE